MTCLSTSRNFRRVEAVAPIGLVMLLRRQYALSVCGVNGSAGECHRPGLMALFKFSQTPCSRAIYVDITRCLVSANYLTMVTTLSLLSFSALLAVAQVIALSLPLNDADSFAVSLLKSEGISYFNGEVTKPLKTILSSQTAFASGQLGRMISSTRFRSR